jgi:hypothetical protein
MIYFYCIVSKEQVYMAENLRLSLEKFNYTLTILTIYDHQLKNLSKIIKFTEFLNCIHYNDDDFIVLMDAFDVLCTTDPSSIPTFFKEHNIDLLISSENTFGNNYIQIKEYYDNYNKIMNTISKYPNSGVIIGRANKFKTFYNDLLKNMPKLKSFIPSDAVTTFSDQTYLINHLYDTKFVDDPSIQIDVFDKIIFTNTNSERDYNINDYIFIHTWGIYLKQKEFEHIKNSQLLKYNKIITDLNLTKT